MRHENLLDRCVHTIRKASTILRASRDGGPSEWIEEGQRWLTGLKMLREATAKSKLVPLLFSDAGKDCSQLINWATIDDVRLFAKKTEYRFRDLREIRGHSQQELVLAKQRRRIASGYIRPYCICLTPDFLREERAGGNPEPLEDETVGLEGEVRASLVRHRQREHRLREEKIRTVLLESGRLQCEVPGCGFDFFKVYGELGRDFAHVHHRAPLAERAEASRTTLAELSIVCANFHAIIHRNGKCRALDGLIDREGRDPR